MGDQNVYPGPVDNSGLLRGKTDDASPPWALIHNVEYIVNAVWLTGPGWLYHSGSSNKEFRGEAEQKQHCGQTSSE